MTQIEITIVCGWLHILVDDDFLYKVPVPPAWRCTYKLASRLEYDEITNRFENNIKQLDMWIATNNIEELYIRFIELLS